MDIYQKQKIIIKRLESQLTASQERERVYEKFVEGIEEACEHGVLIPEGTTIIDRLGEWAEELRKQISEVK